MRTDHIEKFNQATEVYLKAISDAITAAEEQLDVLRKTHEGNEHLRHSSLSEKFKQATEAFDRATDEAAKAAENQLTALQRMHNSISALLASGKAPEEMKRVLAAVSPKTGTGG